MNSLWELIYEDEALLICRKVAGVPVQTAKLGQPDMISLLKNYRAAKGQTADIYLIHRLDQPVEGIMVFAKTKAAAAILNRQLASKAIDKHYLAVLEGKLPQPDGTLEDWLQKDKKANISRVVKPQTSGAKIARLSYRTIAQKDSISLAAIQLETGRHHQIRVQMANLGCPLWGDKKYNPAVKPGHLPIGLCCVKLSFFHPISKAPLHFELKPKGSAFHIFDAHSF